MSKKTNKTVQLGLRIDVQLLRKIEKQADNENIDKMSWMRRALATFVSEQERNTIDDVIEDYIHLRCDEEELKRVASFAKIPEDILQARKDVIAKLKDEV